MRTLIAESHLAFVGRVKAVEPSGITTTFSYPTCKGVTFEWLNTTVEVVEPIKGVQRGDLVKTAMLSVHVPLKFPPYPSTDIVERVMRGEPEISFPRGMINGPGMVDPERGKAYLLFLVPTTVTNVFAALTSPWDDDRSIFILDRHFWKYGSYRTDTNAYSGAGWTDEAERFGVIWSLVDDDGHLLPAGAEDIRRTYRAEIMAAPETNLVIHLQWESVKSPNGWQWDVPKGRGNLTNATESRPAVGSPVTMPMPGD